MHFCSYSLHYGPFQILSKVGHIAYQLDLPKDYQIHNVFYVSLLRKHLGSITPLSSQLPPLADDCSILPQPASILARHEIHKSKYHPKAEVLVNWVGASDEDATWENEWRFFKSYPIFILEEKDSLTGQDCYVLHSMHACNACMAEKH